jgi:hypothetical protein
VFRYLSVDSLRLKTASLHPVNQCRVDALSSNTCHDLALFLIE